MEIFYADLLVLAIDSGGFRKISNIDIISCSQGLGRGNQEPVPFLNDLTDIIRQPAIGEGNMLTALEFNDLSLLIQPPRPGGRCRSDGYPSDNHQF
jgi:hypothetical protein